MMAAPAISVENADAPDAETGAGAPPGSFFPRHLHFSDPKGESHLVDEDEMLAASGEKIVLGEPGMGKSELMRELGRRLGVEPVTAVQFMHHKSPTKLIAPGKPLIIDGLDEAMARRDGDAVDLILAQLEEAGSPEFILSCRSREWQARGASNLRQLYGAEPAIFTIEPLSRAEAKVFLEQRYPGADGDHVLDHLDAHGLTDLYGNPLMLELMGKVAAHDAKLPETRAALLERVCELIWSEHDPHRQDSDLGRIAKEEALSAAGAIMAGLIFSGAEAVSLAGEGQLLEGDRRVAELAALPGGDAARAVFSSKLFNSVGVGRAKPIHKVIAEYLGARWLAQQAVTPRAQRRLLAQLHGSGGVPSSLHGLHAWLAFHSASMAERVIDADPFGVLRYGEAANLTAAQADCMFDALCALAEIDPLFRAGDWHGHTAVGLMTPRLCEKIDATIGSSVSNEHLRSLLIQGLKDTPLAGALADTLEAVVLSGERFYAEREDAAEALLPHRSRAWWQQAIEDLRRQGTENSTRLARNLIEDIDCDVSDELLVATIFSEMGLTISPLPRIKKRRGHTLRTYGRIIKALPASRLARVLDLVTDYAALLAQGDWEHRNDVAEIVSGLLVRAIDEQVVGPSDAGSLWRWLVALGHPDTIYRSELKNLQVRLKERDDLRRAIQHHVLYAARPDPTLWSTAFDLDHHMVGLNSEDAVWFLERLADADNEDPALRQDWCDLMRLGAGADGVGAEARAAGRTFQGEDRQLTDFLDKLEHPKKSAGQHRYEQGVAKRERKARAQNEITRRHYAARREALRKGDLDAITRPAQAYLGQFSDLNGEQPPPVRIAEWLGPDLRDDVLVGLESVLHRSDLPTPVQVAEGFARGSTWNYCYSIMAGLLARQSSGDWFDGVPPEVLTIGLLLCHNDHGLSVDDVSSLREALEAIVIRTEQKREDFAKLWIEPSLAAGSAHVSGLYMLAHDEQWQAAGASVAGRWLADFPNVPEAVELQLVDCLTHTGALDTLASIAAERAGVAFRSFDHMLAWLAIEVLVRFNTVMPDIAGIGAEHPKFVWFLRNRFLLERRGATLPVSVSQAKWIVSEFRPQWPYATLEGSSNGDQNPYDATDFLRTMINRLANDTSTDAGDALQALISEPPDSYSKLIQHMAAEQRQKCAEEAFTPLTPKGLAELLTEGAPSNIDDLKSLVLEELAIAQKKLMGDDLDQVRDFWHPDKSIPFDENRCRDRLAAMIGPELQRYDVQRITEADMPQTKRADLAFSQHELQLPMEVKGQWHPDVWDAATGQLDVQYLIDWRSEGRGIYLVLWFGPLPYRSRRRLTPHPDGRDPPKTPDEMRNMLIERISEGRRALIDVMVLDLTAGKPG